MTKDQFESLIKINNKVIEANFVKLKKYTDQVISELKYQIQELKKSKPVMNSEEPKEEKKEEQQQVPSGTDGFSADDVSIQKIFYYGNK